VDEFMKLFPNIATALRIIDAGEEGLDKIIYDYMRDHMDFLAFEEEKYKTCPNCTDESYRKCNKVLLEPIIFGKFYEAYRKCERVERKIATTMYALIDVFNEYPAYHLHNYIFHTGNKEARRIIEAYLHENSNESFFLHGKTGTGKTHLVVGLAKSLLQKTQPVVYIPMFSLSAILNKLEDDEEKEEVFEKMKACKYLFLDDLGAEKTAKNLNERLLSVLDHRLRNEKPCLVVSNLTADGIKEVYGERIYSRIKSMTEIVIEEKDVRVGKVI